MNKEEIIKYLKEKIKTNQDFIQTIKKVINNSSKTKDYMIILKMILNIMKELSIILKKKTKLLKIYNNHLYF